MLFRSVSKPFTEEKKSSASSSSLYNTFTKKNQSHFIESKSELKHWKDFYEKTEPKEDSFKPQEINNSLIGTNQKPHTDNLTQLHNSFIVVQTDKGYYLVNQQNAHERILYERFALAVEGKPIATQQSLFPATIELNAADAVLLKELLPDMNHLGYQLETFGNNTFVIQGTPADVNQGNEKAALEKMLEQYKHFSNDLKYSKREKLLRSLALQQSIKAGTTLTEREMKVLIEELFNCAVPNSTANGKPTYLEFKKDELDKLFGR